MGRGRLWIKRERRGAAALGRKERKPHPFFALGDQGMTGENEMLESKMSKAGALERMLIARAIGDYPDNDVYERLRRELMTEPRLKELLPAFVRRYRNLDAFWPYIKGEADTYAERRRIIGEAFTPLMDHLEDENRAPSDEVTSKALETFDMDGVRTIWEKALARRITDPEGAITIARTLLETVAKRILDETGETYDDKDDLPKLYARAAGALNLAPNQHTEEPIRAILGGAMNLVNGIGTLRNRLSDSHGRGGRLPVKPSARHASLAVNTAGAVASFLVETFHDRQA